MQKPFNLSALMATVERAVERKRQRASAQLHESSVAISANRDPQRLPELIAASALKVVDAVLKVETLIVDEPEPLSDVGLNVALAPVGTPLTLRFTVPAKQPTALTLAV